MSQHRAAVEKILADLKLKAGSEHPCPYLGDGTPAGMQAREIGFFVDRLPPGFYHGLMDLGFRRSGKLLYRPQCNGCQECRQIRAPAESFKPNRTQRRCFQMNQDLVVTVQPPRPNAERFDLYSRYLAGRHDDGNMSATYESMTGFLYESCVETREASFWLDGKLVAISLLDVEPQALSAVYCFYDPAFEKRSLGLFNMLWSIAYARREQIRWYYLGYFIAACRKMNYKTQIQPCELLQPDGSWQPVPHTPPA